MSIKRPLIGISPWYDEEKRLTYIKGGYCEGIIKAGGIPVVLPLTGDEEILQDIYEKIDGILLSGGDDVDAVHFGEWNLPCNGEISPYRDRMELFLARKVLEEGKPVLGICRGVQMMNVAIGGSLYQDIYSQIRDRCLLQHSQKAPRWYPTHEVVVKSGSKVWKAHGKESVRVNSFHHQAIKDVADGFEITASSPDGMIEAIEFRNHPFAVGVQWHPELMWEKDQSFLELFKDFIENCGK
ncbi:MAG: gamma-glutamyl-gamma-aminobutyrate hydrolase family protein [Clostridia bacterium]|nr:gamma-glutamyl-gamma-aminobutyrate hydrolase family protein [Clostridia bacterium]